MSRPRGHHDFGGNAGIPTREPRTVHRATRSEGRNAPARRANQLQTRSRNGRGEAGPARAGCSVVSNQDTRLPPWRPRVRQPRTHRHPHRRRSPRHRHRPSARNSSPLASCAPSRSTAAVWCPPSGAGPLPRSPSRAGHVSAPTRERPAPGESRPFAERTLKAAPECSDDTSRPGLSTDPAELAYMADRFRTRGFIGFDPTSNTVYVSAIEVDRTRCTCGARPPRRAMAAHG